MWFGHADLCMIDGLKDILNSKVLLDGIVATSVLKHKNGFVMHLWLSCHLCTFYCFAPQHFVSLCLTELFGYCDSAGGVKAGPESAMKFLHFLLNFLNNLKNKSWTRDVKSFSPLAVDWSYFCFITSCFNHQCILPCSYVAQLHIFHTNKINMNP